MVMLISSTGDLTGWLGPVGGPSTLGLAYISVGRAFDSVMSVTECRISLFFRVRERGVPSGSGFPSEALAEVAGDRQQVAEDPLDEGALPREVRGRRFVPLLEVREGLNQPVGLLGA